MPTLIPDCIREEKDDRVMLVHPVTGRKVSLGSWEARVLPYLDRGLDGRGIAAHAAEAGVNMPAEHVTALLERLRAAGLLMALGHRVQLPVGAQDTRPPVPPPARAAPAGRADAPLWDSSQRPEPAPEAPPLRAHEAADALHAEMLSSPGHRVIPVIPAARPAPSDAPSAAAPTQVNLRPRQAGAVDAFREEFTDGLRVIKPLDVNTSQLELSAVRRMQPEVHRLDEGVLPSELAASASFGLPEDAEPPPDSWPEPPPNPSALTLMDDAPPLAHGDLGPPRYGTEVLRDAPARVRPPIRWGRVMTVVVVLSLGLAAAYGVPVPYTERAPCVLLPIERRSLRAEVDGALLPAELDEGSEVKEGQVVVTIDAPTLKADLAATNAEIMNVMQEIEKLRVGERPDVVRARTLVQARSVAQRQARAEFRRAEHRHARGQVGAEELHRATTMLATAKKSLTDAQAALVDKLATTAQDELRVREADLERLKARQMRMVDQTDRLEVRSPISGRLATPYFREKAGLTVRAGDEVAQVIQLDRMRAEARVSESVAATVRVGDSVVLELSNGHQLRSRVEALGSSVEGRGDERFVRVLAPVENRDLRLRQNATATMLVRGGQRTVLERARRELDVLLR